MKTKINRDTCIACGNCYALCPEVYESDDDGIAYCHLDNNAFSDKNVPLEVESQVIDALECCPTGSVIVEKE